MATAEIDDRVGAPATSWFGRAFGVPLAAELPLETVAAAVGPLADPTTWQRADPGRDDDVEADAWTRLVDFRFEDGSPMMTIDVAGDGRYRIAAPDHGRHVVSDDGRRIVSTLDADASWRWQRLFTAQVLPLASALRGLEPLHASAVGIDGGAVAFTAASGTGKTSTAVHLAARGATLLTDDVLALEVVGDTAVAHPGCRLLSVDRAELDSVGDRAGRLGELLGEADKVYLRPPIASAPLPLHALYRLHREAPGTPFRVEEHGTVGALDLLGATFLTYLRSPLRLERQLDVASQLAKRVRVFSIHVPAGLAAADSAALIERHVLEERNA